VEGVDPNTSLKRLVAFWPARATDSAWANLSSRAFRTASAWAWRSSALWLSARVDVRMLWMFSFNTSQKLFF
jgi:hypothetical protein